MIMVGRLQLIFDDNLSTSVFFFGQNIDIEIANACFCLDKRNIYPNFITQQLKIFWHGKPIHKI